MPYGYDPNAFLKKVLQQNTPCLTSVDAEYCQSGRCTRFGAACRQSFASRQNTGLSLMAIHQIELSRFKF